MTGTSAPPAALPDVIGDGLRVLLCGINPSCYSAAAGHHFARPGNRFWPALHLAGLTPRRLAPDEDAEVTAWGLGLTNLVARPTVAAAELTPDELRAGAARLAGTVARHRPERLVFLGLGAYRRAFDRPRATTGRQDDDRHGCPVWLVPNPSGLQARYQLPDLVTALRAATAGLGLPETAIAGE